MGLIDFYRIFCLNVIERIFFLVVYRIFFKIDYVLGYKVSFNRRIG